MSHYLEIDGSVLEGGGQILRISISLSAILGVAVRVTKIRAGRSKPGLAAQHTKGIQLVGEMCGAKIKGAHVGSTEVEFSPGKIRGGHYFADPQTAGSISLLLQVALPCALMADGPVTFDLKGGTNADMAPQIDYMTEIFRRYLRMFNADFTCEVRRRGYFPRGGGHVSAAVWPVRRLRGCDVTERGELTRVRGISFVAGTLPVKLAYLMSDAVKEEIKQICRDVDIKCYKEDRNFAPDNCSGIVVWCELSGGGALCGDALGGRGRHAGGVGAAAGAALRAAAHAGGCVDMHAQDQVILYMALAEGKSAVRTGEVTLHTKTAIYIAELIAKTKFDIRPDGDQNIIECTGIGYLNKNIPEC